MDFLVDFIIGKEKRIKTELIKAKNLDEIKRHLKEKYKTEEIKITGIYKNI